MSEERLAGEKGKNVETIKKEAEEKACAVRKALYFIEEFISGPMCGKCFPCALGTAEAKIRLSGLAVHRDNISVKDIETLRRVGLQMIEGSFCKKGKDTGKFLLDTLSAAGDEFIKHLSGVCPKKECISLIRYEINPDLCIMCNNCAEACKHHAIIGEKRSAYRSGFLPYQIRQKKCTKCGDCLPVCPTAAVVLITDSTAELVNN
jgi:NAD-dependent dihydropyrimidine dehydrogenase PreA subunit